MIPRGEIMVTTNFAASHLIALTLILRRPLAESFSDYVRQAHDWNTVFKAALERTAISTVTTTFTVIISRN